MQLDRQIAKEIIDAPIQRCSYVAVRQTNSKLAGVAAGAVTAATFGAATAAGAGAVAAGVGAGAAGGAAGELVGETVNAIQGEGFSVGEVLENTAVGAATGVVPGLCSLAARQPGTAREVASAALGVTVSAVDGAFNCVQNEYPGWPYNIFDDDEDGY